MFCDPPRSNRHVQTGIFKPPLLAKSTGEGLGSAWLCKRMIHLLIKPKNKEALSISWGTSMRGSDPKLSNEQLGLDLGVPPRMEPGPVGDGEEMKDGVEGVMDVGEEGGHQNSTALAAVHEMGTAGGRCPAEILRQQHHPAKTGTREFCLVLKKPWLFRLAEKS